MKKFFILCFILIISTNISFSKESEAQRYINKYNAAKMADFELVKDLDPYQVEEYYKYAWAPYPLFRTSTDLYFKKLHIIPGYYILTPRTIKDKQFVFFKQGGKVVYIVPVCETDMVTKKFYKEMTPEPKRNVFGKIYYHTRTGFYKIFKKSKKQNPPDSHIEVSTIDGVFLKIDLYYGAQCYTMYFRTVKDI